MKKTIVLLAVLAIVSIPATAALGHVGVADGKGLQVLIPNLDENYSAVPGTGGLGACVVRNSLGQAIGCNSGSTCSTGRATGVCLAIVSVGGPAGCGCVTITEESSLEQHPDADLAEVPAALDETVDWVIPESLE